MNVSAPWREAALEPRSTADPISMAPLLNSMQGQSYCMCNLPSGELEPSERLH